MKFITSRYQIQILFQVHPWRKLVTECDQLDRVIIQLVDDGDYTQEAENIERELRQLRPAIIFRTRTVELHTIFSWSFWENSMIVK